MIGETEEESFDSFPELASVAFIIPDEPTKPLYSPLPGNLARIFAVPLRC
jgi:hypothetical protein